MKTNRPVLRHAGIFAVTLAFYCGAALAQTASSDRTAREIPVRAGSTNSLASLITRVEVGRDGSQTTVRVTGNGLMSYTAEHMNNPERLVLDFSGVRMTAVAQPVPSSVQPVERIRLGQFKPDVARVVIDLASAVPYNVRADGSAILVTFAAVPAAPAGRSASVAQQPSQDKQVVDSVRPKPAVPAKPKKAAPTGISGMPLPEWLTRHTAGLASPKQQDPPATGTAPAAQQPPPPAQQPQHMKGAGTSSTGQKYTGEPISVNFKDLDLKDFFRLIHEISGLNVVLDPGVKGSLPALVLDEVPWDQALDIVLKNNSLDKELDGNVLRIASKETIKRELDMQRELAKAQAEAVDPVTSTRVLSYTKATTMSVTLKRWLSAKGEIVADDRSNTLIIRDIPSVFPDIDNLIRQLDRKSQQVEIEARVVAASRSFARDIGTQFAFSAGSTGGRTGYGVTTGLTAPILTASPATAITSALLPIAVGLGAGAPNSGAAFSHTSPNFALDIMISAAEAKGVGRLLSKPKVYTQNNQKGTVKQGNRVPIQTTINNTVSVQYIDAVLKLEVTPQITADGTIFMQVQVENTQIDAGIPRVQGIPALDTQSVETNVLINDGGTVAIGGITVSQQRTDVTQVPLFGSIPLIGHLFKRNAVNVTSSELWFFLTPRIIQN